MIFPFNDLDLPFLQATGARLGVMCQSMASIGVGIIIGFIFSWKLTLVILIFLPAIGVAGVLQMKIIEGYASAGLAALEGAGKVGKERELEVMVR